MVRVVAVKQSEIRPGAIIYWSKGPETSGSARDGYYELQSIDPPFLITTTGETLDPKGVREVVALVGDTVEWQEGSVRIRGKVLRMAHALDGSGVVLDIDDGARTVSVNSNRLVVVATAPEPEAELADPPERPRADNPKHYGTW